MKQSDLLSFYIIEDNIKHQLLGIKEYQIDIDNVFVDNLNLSSKYTKNLQLDHSNTEINIQGIYVKNEAMHIIKKNSFENKILSCEINFSQNTKISSNFVIKKFCLHEEVNKETKFLISIKQTKILQLQ